MSARRRLLGVAHELRVMAAVLADAYVRPRPRAADGPLVTVVIAAYNRSEVLRHALASAIRQTYPRLEILVIGDACTDDSEQVVAAAGDARVRWINLERNSGSQAGPNQAGLEAARGELVAYLGQDDVWRRDHVALLVADLERTGADLTYSVTSYVWPRPYPVRRLMSEAPGAWVPPSSVAHTRAAALAAGGWRDHRTTVLPPDHDFVARMLESGHRFSRVRALSVVKFGAGVRPGIYGERPSAEQAAAIGRVDRRSFVAREVLATIALAPLRRRHGRWPRIEQGADGTPGGVVAQLRRIRGLEP